MLWMNKNKTKYLDFQNISFWKFISMDDIKCQRIWIEESRRRDPSAWYFDPPTEATLEVHIGTNSPLTFTGAEDEEIYRTLIAWLSGCPLKQ